MSLSKNDEQIPTFKQATRDLLMRALSCNGGNRIKAARALGVTDRTVRNWIREFQLRDAFPTRPQEKQEIPSPCLT